MIKFNYKILFIIILIYGWSISIFGTSNISNNDNLKIVNCGDFKTRLAVLDVNAIMQDSKLAELIRREVKNLSHDVQKHMNLKERGLKDLSHKLIKNQNTSWR